MRNARRFLIATLSLLLASLTWWPLMAHLYRPSDQRRAVLRDGLFERQLALFSMRAQRDQTLQTLRWANPEWDLMARTFFVLAATNRALRQTGRAPRVLAAIDSLLDDTLQLIKRHGQEVFLLSYGRKRRWPRERVRSHFVASQVLMMLAARRAVGDAPRWRQAYRQRAAQMVGQLSAPFYSAASYPNELWTFCNAVGLAALKLGDRLDGTDHSELFRRWSRAARKRLSDRKTKLLISAFDSDGRRKQGPEGSSIWLAIHMLQLTAPNLARSQYRLARRQLVDTLLGFAFSREWTKQQPSRPDIDSGLIIPGIDASPSASAFLLLAARQQNDRQLTGALLASLELAAFPTRTSSGIRFAAGNLLGDTVLLYALEAGPLWRWAKTKRTPLAGPEARPLARGEKGALK